MTALDVDALVRRAGHYERELAALAGRCTSLLSRILDLYPESAPLIATIVERQTVLLVSVLESFVALRDRAVAIEATASGAPSTLASGCVIASDPRLPGAVQRTNCPVLPASRFAGAVFGAALGLELQDPEAAGELVCRLLDAGQEVPS